MRDSVAKAELLERAGYVYNFDRQLYLNRRLKKAFSIQFLQDHSEDEIKRAIEAPEKEKWMFFFNDAPSAAVERELTNVLG